jgi:hypothetical protein
MDAKVAKEAVLVGHGVLQYIVAEIAMDPRRFDIVDSIGPLPISPW